MTTQLSQPPIEATTGSTRVRLLSKSDFKVASTCPTKLYYRKMGYPDAKSFDAYLALLARGGYMVEKLAKLQYPDGITVDTSKGHLAAAEETLRLLGNEDDVTLFEATVIHDGRLARIDILRKIGNHLHLMEVKASLLDRMGEAERYEKTGSYFRNKNRGFGISADWRDYLEDVTYQYTILRDIFPQLQITPYLVLIDREYTASVDGLPQCFRMISGADGRLQDVVFTGDADATRRAPMTLAVPVISEVAELEPEVRTRSLELRESLTPLRKLEPQLGRHCRDCEFRTEDKEGRSGFAECWADRANQHPLVFDLYHARDAGDAWIKRGISALVHIDLDEIRGDGKIAARQRIQIEHTRAGTEWIEDGLKRGLEAAEYPLHFVDFEAGGFAVPQFSGMHPYGQLAFQWSCHTLAAPGGELEHKEFLNTEDPWPNKLFAETLRDAIGSEGTILTWSPYEANVLKRIWSDLEVFGPDPKLAAWLKSLFDPSPDEPRRIIDLHALCREYYFHPLMGGRTSIKNVLDALWKSSPEMRIRFEQLQGYPGDAELGPYAALPPIVIGERYQVVADGGNAMHAYEAMMYGLERERPEVRAAWSKLLRQYCQLDTLAMVLIWESWVAKTGAVPGN